MINSLDEQIRYRAYLLWEAEGCPAGKEMDYWLKAEREIKSELVRSAAPKTPRAKSTTAKAKSTKSTAAKSTAAKAKTTKTTAKKSAPKKAKTT